MAFEQMEGAGSLFRNTEKLSDRSPDYSGSIKVRGQVLKLAGWIKESKDGKKFLSLFCKDTAGQAQDKPAFNDQIKF